MRSRAPRALLVVLVLVLVIGGAVALAVTQRSNERTPRVSSPPLTSLPEAAASPGCHAGAFALTASLATLPPSVCLQTGATLTVTFDKSTGGLGSPGPWTIPPLSVEDGAILGLRSHEQRGHLLTAVLVATATGSTAVSAHFDEECSGTESTPCTIPPQNTISVNVAVSP